MKPTRTKKSSNGRTKSSRRREVAVATGTTKSDAVVRDHVATADELVEQLRAAAESVLARRPYLLPVATGAAGLGIGVVLSSKLLRAILVSTAGKLLDETVRTQFGRVARELLS